MISIYDAVLPDGWQSDELRRVTRRKRGYSWAKEDETDRSDPSTVPVLRIPNIQGKLDLSGLLYLRNVPETAMLESGVTKDWILFVGSNGNPDRIGDSALMTIDRPMVFASFLMAIASRDPDRITPEFLAAWLKLHKVHEAFSKNSQQTTGLANFSWSAVKRLPFRFPGEKREQQAITCVIDVADQAVTAAEAKLAAAGRLKTALMQQLFTRGIPGRHKRFRSASALQFEFETPDSWEIAPLRRSVAKVEYGTNAASNRGNHGLPVVAIPEVVASRFQLGDCSYAEVTDQEAEALRLQPDDVLLIRTNGNAEYIGKSTVIGTEAAETHIIYASYLIRVQTDKSKLSGRYLNYFLASPLGRRQCLTMANTSAGNHNLGARAIKHFVLPRPSHDEQEEIVAVLNSAEDAIEAAQVEIDSLDQLKRSLLQNLLTGRIRIRN